MFTVQTIACLLFDPSYHPLGLGSIHVFTLFDTDRTRIGVVRLGDTIYRNVSPECQMWLWGDERTGKSQI